MTAQGGNALSLIKAVRELVAERRTGVLDVRADGVGTRIYFDAGKPVFAEDDAPGETFGRLLVRQGVLANEQFVRVIDAMTLAAKGDNPLRFGEVAVGQGVLTREQVERGLADQVCGIINRALQRDESRWTFDASPSAAKPPRSFSIDIEAIVLAATLRLPETSKVVGAEAVGAVAPRVQEEVGKREFQGPGASTHAARLAAEQAFQKGTALLRASQTESAAIELRRASLLQPESLEYTLSASWAEARARSEIPSEADRRRLLEIAQRAKKRDPLFAFGSYVLGQLALWAGDEATAKKWFYEALRLDPASEAGREVRILARRGTGTLGPPGPGEPSHHDDTVEKAPLAAPAPVPAKPSEPARVRKPNRGAKWLLSGAALLATAALVMFGTAKESVPRAGRAPSPASAPVDAGPSDSVPGTERPEATSDKATSDKATSDKAAGGEDRGTVRLPPRAAGHRIYVDGRRVQADETEPLHLPCGPHVIQIGSQGTPQPIDLRCGGEVQLQ
jgi:tetratricopeptide (TPR) repeat protein